MLFKSILGAASVCLVVVSFNAYAVPINISKDSDDNYLTDGLTGLDWLEVTETIGMSYDGVSAQLGAGGDFAGWSYATSAQVVTLWGYFGVDLSESAVPMSTGREHDSTAVRSLLGYTIGGPGCIGGGMTCALYPEVGLLGITSTSPYKFQRDIMGSIYQFDHVDGSSFGMFTDTNYYYTQSSNQVDDDESNWYFGSYLVRDATGIPVPEPSIAILMASGLIAFGVVRRKNIA